MPGKLSQWPPAPARLEPGQPRPPGAAAGVLARKRRQTAGRLELRWPQHLGGAPSAHHPLPGAKATNRSARALPGSGSCTTTTPNSPSASRRHGAAASTCVARVWVVGGLAEEEQLWASAVPATWARVHPALLPAREAEAGAGAKCRRPGHAARACSVRAWSSGPSARRSRWGSRPRKGRLGGRPKWVPPRAAESGTRRTQKGPARGPQQRSKGRPRSSTAGPGWGRASAYEEEAQQGGLAVPVGAQHRQHLPGLQGEAHPLQEGRPATL